MSDESPYDNKPPSELECLKMQLSTANQLLLNRDMTIATLERERDEAVGKRQHYQSMLETLLAGVQAACDGPRSESLEEKTVNAVLNQTKSMVQWRDRAQAAELDAERLAEALARLVGGTKHAFWTGHSADITGGRQALAAHDERVRGSKGAST